MADFNKISDEELEKVDGGITGNSTCVHFLRGLGKGNQKICRNCHHVKFVDGRYICTSTSTGKNGTAVM